MPIQKDPSGRRSVQAEVEVPGTPEEVWAAIATGPGISSWFVPHQVEERVGGAVTGSFGPGMDSSATITEWEPPRRFVAESHDNMGPDDPTIATEWTVEALDGGTCRVRVVHSWFTNRDDWDEQFEGHSYGWLAFFRILRLYCTHFGGQTCTAFQLMGMTNEPVPNAWAELTRGLGLADPSVGQRVQTGDAAPRLAGLVEHVGPAEYPDLLLCIDQPAPGIVHLFALPMGQTFLSIRFFLYGAEGPEAAAQHEPLWQAWLNSHFPMPSFGEPAS